MLYLRAVVAVLLWLLGVILLLARPAARFVELWWWLKQPPRTTHPPLLYRWRPSLIQKFKAMATETSGKSRNCCYVSFSAVPCSSRGSVQCNGAVLWVEKVLGKGSPSLLCQVSSRVWTCLVHCVRGPRGFLPGSCSNCLYVVLQLELLGTWHPKCHPELVKNKRSVCVAGFWTLLSFRVLAYWYQQNKSKSVGKQKLNF